MRHDQMSRDTPMQRCAKQKTAHLVAPAAQQPSNVPINRSNRQQSSIGSIA